jgi:hypothetical protein
VVVFTSDLGMDPGTRVIGSNCRIRKCGSGKARAHGTLKRGRVNGRVLRGLCRLRFENIGICICICILAYGLCRLCSLLRVPLSPELVDCAAIPSDYLSKGKFDGPIYFVSSFLIFFDGENHLAKCDSMPRGQYQRGA